ncbi:hypothetical protein ACIP5Z_05175 [Rothia terrae]|uniref:hypothetical protein n=1 Tax=Rothia terrae TaxID=396015 RepID=UPI0038171763
MKEHENAQGKNAMRLRALVPLCAALTLAVAGCSSNNDVATNDASASASAQTSQSAQVSASPEPAESTKATDTAKPADSAKASGSPSNNETAETAATSDQASDKTDENASQSLSPEAAKDSAPETFEGADKIASAPTVPLDNADVSTAKDLYNSFEQNLTSITLEKAANAPAEDAEPLTETEEKNGIDTGYGQLSQETEDKINEVSMGNAADSYKASALEFGINGWSQEGQSSIVGEPKVTDTDYQDKPAKLLEVCLDSSNVKVKDAAGNLMVKNKSQQRSLNIFTLIQDGGSWKIANQTFPNNPDC